MVIRTLATAAFAVAAAVLAPAGMETSAPLHAATPVAMTTFTIDPVHSQMLFKVRHLGLSTVTGRFGTFAGTFQLDPASGQAGAAALSIDVASLSTNNDRRDTHLRSADFFAADSFPKLTFTSTGIQKVGPNKYKVMGNITIRSTTRPIVLDAELAGTRQTATGWLAAVNMTGSIKRKEFGLMWDRLTEGVAIVGEDVQLVIEVEAKSAP